MWHEARKQERLIRGLIRIDYRKRAERRQDFYAKIQADPTQFIQVHGRRCKIHLDPAVAAAGDGAAIIVPWQGQQDNLIDRFDVRAHLDYIPPVVKPSANDGTDADADITQEERQLNYERYRILAQNDFLNVNEDKFLHQLYLEEQFGANAQLEAERNQGRKKQKTGGATIGYSYEDAGESSSAIGPQPFGHLMNVASQPPSTASSGVAVKTEKEGSDESDDSDIDMDVSIDIAKLETAQAHELNACGRNYGMKGNDFFSHLTRDADEIESLRIAREEEQEKMLLSGRKSRRERRAQKERRIANRPFSPPSYAAKEEKGKHDKDEESDSRSPSPADGGGEKITYITSFGGEDEMQPHSKITINIAKPGQTLGESCISASSGAAASGHVTYAQKVKDNLDKLKIMNETAKRTGRRRSQSRSRSRSRKRSRRRSYHRSRSHSRRRRRYRYSRSRSSSRNRYASRSPSYKRSRKRYTSSSRSSSTSSYEMSHRRRTRTSTISRSPSPARRDRPLAKKRSPPTVTKTFCMSTTTTTTTITAPAHVPTKLMPQQKPVISQAVAPTPPMISYPLPTRTMTLSTAISAAAPIPAAALQQVVEPPPPPLKRYYGRKRDDTSSSSTESSGASDAETDPTKLQRNRAERDDSEEPDVDTASECSHPLQPSMSSSTSTGNQTGKYSSATETKGCGQGSSATGGGGRPNLRERLKRKMQNLLNRQYKADKRAEIEKTERERQQQQVREDEMRELALKLRRRRRELRHKYGTPSSGKITDSEAESVESESQSKLVKPPRRSRSNSYRSPSRKRSPPEAQSASHRQFRRSNSRGIRRRRSTSRDRRQRSCSRSRRSSSRMERKRRSRSRRSVSRDRRRSRSRRRRSMDRNRDRERSMERNRERERERERERDRDRERYRQHGRGDRRDRVEEHRHGSGTASSGNRGRVVISAPPKLKKLVDY